MFECLYAVAERCSGTLQQKSNIRKSKGVSPFDLVYGIKHKKIDGVGRLDNFDKSCIFFLSMLLQN